MIFIYKILILYLFSVNFVEFFLFGAYVLDGIQNSEKSILYDIFKAISNRYLDKISHPSTMSLA